MDWLSELPQILKASISSLELKLSDNAIDNVNEERWNKFLSGEYSKNIFDGIY